MKIIKDKENIASSDEPIFDTLKKARIIKFEKILKTGKLAVFRDGCSGAYRADIDSGALRKLANEIIELADRLDA